MKLFYTLIASFLFTSVIAQESYDLSLGANFIIDHRQEKIHTGGVVKLENNKATITSGIITGNFEGKPRTKKNNHSINGNKYWFKPALFASKNKLNMHCGEQEFCFTTNPIDVTNTKEISFSIDFSGKGTLDQKDPPDGKVWHDWIKVNHLLDGQLYEGKTMNGIPKNVASQEIDVMNAESFQIQICMRNTGHDEWFTIEKIEITETPLMEIDLATVEVVAPKAELIQTVISCGGNYVKQPTIPTDELSNAITPKENVVNSPTLSVFPNPTSNSLELLNSEKYDLSSIQILDAGGKIISVANSYPLNISILAAGTYFIAVLEKETKQQVSTSFVIVHP